MCQRSEVGGKGLIVGSSFSSVWNSRSVTAAFVVNGVSLPPGQERGMRDPSCSDGDGRRRGGACLLENVSFPFYCERGDISTPVGVKALPRVMGSQFHAACVRM